jgi:predicted nucleic acid-binding protein
MYKLKLYLETSVWNFIFADDAPEKRDLTHEFFNVVKKGVYEIYASEIVINEIQRADLEKRQKLMKEIDNYKPIQLETNDEMRRLAQAYMEAKIVPAKKVEDALHVSIATVSGLDAVISWNFDHLANLRKADLFNGVNLLQGYSKRIEIVSPMEVSRV